MLQEVGWHEVVGQITAMIRFTTLCEQDMPGFDLMKPL